MPAVDFRELVKSPVEMTGKFDVRADPHPLHVGISGKRQFHSPSMSPIMLPRGGAGLARLKTSILDLVPGMDADRSLEAHARLLSAGQFVHATPGAVRVGPDGEELEDQVVARTRSVVIAAVFRDPEEKFMDNVFTTPRFGGVGVLAVVSDAEDQRRTEDAWLQVGWHYTSSAMVRAIAQVPGLVLEPPTQSRRIEILVAPEFADASTTMVAQVNQIAMLLGASPQTHVVSADQVGAVAGKVRASNPFELIVLGSSVDESVVEEFTRRHGERNLHRARVSTVADALQWLLDNLPRIMGVGPGLISQPQLAAVAGRPRMPVKNPVRCLHHGSNHYILDGDSGEWWTRDFAQHGKDKKSIFKVFALVDGVLVWRSDRDGVGAVITDKHKGERGAKISESETSSCGYPESHVH